MSPILALDRFYLSLTLLITVAYQLAGFAIAWTLQFDKITDFTGGSNFFILALVTLLLGQNFHPRNIVASICVMVWAVRIAGFLLYRVVRTGSDNRFDEIRSNLFKFLGFWTGQIIWVWVVSLPLTVLNSPIISLAENEGLVPAFGTSRDIAGVVLWTLGWFVETVADVQKFRYKQSNRSPKNGPIRSGLWAWSRHPPYFGEIICWWGIWVLCLSPSTNGNVSSTAKAAQYGAVVSPLFTFLILMFGSGVPTAERPQAKKYYLLSHVGGVEGADASAWNNYKRYVTETSILLPIPPIVYRWIPVQVKRTVLLDFGMYQFDESRDGKAALEEAQNEAG